MSTSSIPIRFVRVFSLRVVAARGSLAAAILTAAVLLPAQEKGGEASRGWQVRSSDQVAWIGGAFTERLQQTGYLETALAIQSAATPPPKHRNLGWSGDTPSGISRAVFGSPEDGFRRLIHDTLIAKPTVVVLNYGHAEAFEGPEGVERFQRQLGRLVSELKKRMKEAGGSSPRFIYLFPPPRLAVGPGAVGAEAYNKNLALYRDAAKAFCEKEGAAFFDLGAPLVENPAWQKAVEKYGDQVSLDGLQLESLGQWLLAQHAAKLFGPPAAGWSLTVDAAAKKVAHSAGEAEITSAGAEMVQLEIRDAALPAPPPPRGVPDELRLREDMLQVKGLAPGEYTIQIGDSAAPLTATAAELAAGVRFARGEHLAQVEQLRAAINKKNELFFHRHRPQNETYLFLFRKHEQGNNAVEIPAFDPLIEQEEERIAQLAAPQPYRITLRRTGG